MGGGGVIVRMRCVAGGLALAFLGGCGAVGPSARAIVHFGGMAPVACEVKRGQDSALVQKACGEPRARLSGTAFAECWIYDNQADSALSAGAGGDEVAVCFESRSQSYTRESKPAAGTLVVAEAYGLRRPPRPAPALDLPPPPPPPPPGPDDSGG